MWKRNGKESISGQLNFSAYHFSKFEHNNLFLKHKEIIKMIWSSIVLQQQKTILRYVGTVQQSVWMSTDSVNC